jgi:glyoxylate reductase
MNIFVTRKIPEPGLDLLRKEHEIEVFPHDRVPTKDEIIKELKGKDGLLCLLSDPIDKEVINSV